MSKFVFQQSFGRVLGAAATLLFRRLSKELKDHQLPITPDQFKVLTHLWQKDGRSQQELADLSDRNRANVTRIIDILEREGLVARKDDENDRRVFQIHLTKAGKDLEAAAAGCAKKTLEDACKGVSEEELRICRKVLQKMIENLA
jgi:DNA-binding MarR family transcriptional regulator